MDEVKERELNEIKKKGKGKADQEQRTADEQRHDPWPPSGEPGERSDKDAIGRPVQLDKD
jgi:hypothetical protein